MQLPQIVHLEEGIVSREGSFQLDNIMKHNLVNLIRCLKLVLQIVLYMHSHFTYSVKYYIIPC